MPLTNIIILALLAVAAIAAMGLGWMISKKNGTAVNRD
jgi:flagellar basal body-associated protein FliL